jgi:hypothetical protein
MVQIEPGEGEAQRTIQVELHPSRQQLGSKETVQQHHCRGQRSGWSIIIIIIIQSGHLVDSRSEGWKGTQHVLGIQIPSCSLDSSVQ